MSIEQKAFKNSLSLISLPGCALQHKITSKEESIMDPSKMLEDKRDEIICVWISTLCGRSRKRICQL